MPGVPTLVCCQCHDDVELAKATTWLAKDTQYGRCRSCTSVNTAMSSVKKRLAGTALEDWTSTSIADRREFLLKHRGEGVLALKSSIETFTESKCTDIKERKAKETGEYYDEEDLKEKLKGKPKQLAATLRNASTMYCKVRECDLYSLPNYKSSVIAKRVEEDMNSMAGSSTELVKNKKKNKAVNDADEAMSVAAKRLKVPKDKLESLVTEVNNAIELAKTSAYVDYVPKKQMHAATLKLAAGKSAAAEVELASGTGYTGIVSEVIQAAKNEGAVLQTVLRQLKSYITEAEADMEEEEGEVDAEKEEKYDQ